MKTSMPFSFDIRISELTDKGQAVVGRRVENGQVVVRGGWAVEYKYFRKRFFAADEMAAKNGARGIWQGRFQHLWE